MAGLMNRTPLLIARAIVSLPGFLAAAGVGRVRRAGPVCGATGH
jgi:hypothetical protein